MLRWQLELTCAFLSWKTLLALRGRMRLACSDSILALEQTAAGRQPVQKLWCAERLPQTQPDISAPRKIFTKTPNMPFRRVKEARFQEDLGVRIDFLSMECVVA